MEIKKQFKFSGIFRKLQEEDSKPIEISNANVLCYTNGHIFLEVNAQVTQYINEKLFLEQAPLYQSKDKTRQYEQQDPLDLLSFDWSEAELIQKAYEGNYGIQGQTVEGWKITAILANHSFTVSFTVGNVNNVNPEDKSKLRFKALYIDYNLEMLKEKETEEIIYGLANIEVFYQFSANIGNLDTEIDIKSVITKENRRKTGILSAEMRLKNVDKTEQDTYENYSYWIIYLLSLASGHYVDKIYKIEGIMDEKFKIKREYWTGLELLNKAKGRAVIQSPDVPLFIQQCAKKLNWDTFNDKGLSLALYWYIDTFVSTKSEVNFLTLCTVLEILNKRHSNNSSKRLLPKEIYKQIRKEIIETISNFKDNIDNKDYLEQYNKFEIKVNKSFESGSYNQMGSLQTTLKKMLNYYHVPYEDLFPELEFIKIRDKIVHEGFSEAYIVKEWIKLSNLVVRVFLAMLEYEGNYMESRNIDLDDNFEHKKYGLICKSFPFTTSKDNLNKTD